MEIDDVCVRLGRQFVINRRRRTTVNRLTHNVRGFVWISRQATIKTMFVKSKCRLVGDIMKVRHICRFFTSHTFLNKLIYLLPTANLQTPSRTSITAELRHRDAGLDQAEALRDK